jgi:UDP-glucose 4-epimerase
MSHLADGALDTRRAQRLWWRARTLERRILGRVRRGGEVGTLAVVGHGFIGGRIARRALSEGWKVRSLARRDPQRRLEPGHELFIGDAREPELALALLAGADHVVFAAGTAKPAESNEHPMHEVAANLGPLLAVLNAIPRTSVGAITLLSSGGTVYGPDAPAPTPETAALWPISAYGVLKVASERYVAMHAQQHGLSADILRCANVYGPGEPTYGSQGLIGVTRGAIRANRPVVVYGDDFIHVDDVAAAVMALAGRPAGVRVLNVGSGCSVSVHEVIAAVAGSLGREAVLEHRPGRPTDVPVVELDVSALRAVIDFDPRDLTAGLAGPVSLHV